MIFMMRIYYTYPQAFFKNNFKLFILNEGDSVERDCVRKTKREERETFQFTVHSLNGFNNSSLYNVKLEPIAPLNPRVGIGGPNNSDH